MTFLFDPSLLKDLDLSEFGIKFEPGFSLTKPYDSIVVRPLEREDYEKGFPKILTHLTNVGSVSEEMFEKQFDLLKSADGYYPIVVEDTAGNKGNGEIVGTATLEIEKKIIHSCASRGRIEDVVVNPSYRGRKLGKILVGTLTLLSKKLKCYKTTLECKDDNIPFYNVFGYKKDSEKYMQLRFKLQ